MAGLLAQSPELPALTSLTDCSLPPAWVLRALGTPGASSRLEHGLQANHFLADSNDATPGEVGIATRSSSRLRLVSAFVRHASSLSVPDFQSAIMRAIDRIREAMASETSTIPGQNGQSPPWHPIRFWNYIPDIHAPAGGGLDRYMAFNAARFAAFVEWFGGADAFADSVATATGVGHGGNDLIMHALAGNRSGQPVENPRQIPSYSYSPHYGPLPPCFARATLTKMAENGRSSLLIGGTSSVRGEASVHTGDAVRQTEETLKNLASLILAAEVQLQPSAVAKDMETTLKRLRNVRLYVKRPEDTQAVLSTLLESVPHLEFDEIEVVRADICRRELLIEIEGTAELEPR